MKKIMVVLAIVVFSSGLAFAKETKSKEASERKKERKECIARCETLQNDCLRQHQPPAKCEVDANQCKARCKGD